MPAGILTKLALLRLAFLCHKEFSMVRFVGGMALLLTGVACLFGCGSKPAVVSGKVTYDGEPVRNGYISFIPDDGKGASSGAQIRNGMYKALDVPPGKKRVEVRSTAEVTAMPDMEPPRTKPDMKTPEAKLPEDEIPPDAVGNNELVDIGRGNVKHDVALERPKKRK